MFTIMRLQNVVVLSHKFYYHSEGGEGRGGVVGYFITGAATPGIKFI